MEDCGYCKEKENKIRSYEEEIENEKIRECQKALEREKIARGMMSTKRDQIRLKEMQKWQMKERKLIEQEEQDREMMWHQVLLDDYHRKVQFERAVEQRRQQEMVRRRMCYNEQIASANRKRQEMLQMEREKENRRLEKIRKKMEQDYFEAIKTKKEQQMTNKKNFIESHQMKLSRLNDEKMRARAIDTGTIREALSSLKQEEERNRIQMKSLQMEKQICIDNYNREKRIASALSEETDRIADEWQQQEHMKTDKFLREIEEEKYINRQKAADEYKMHLQHCKMEIEQAKRERTEKMLQVRETAVKELRRRMDQANEELKRQIDYRNALNRQIIENQKHLESDIRSIENKETAFTKNAVMFKDAMESRLKISSGRTSTNPVHPFQRLIESKQGN